MLDEKTRNAEAMFKRAEDSDPAVADHHAAAQAVRDKTAHLRALRLAKEAADGLESDPVPRRAWRRRTKLKP